MGIKQIFLNLKRFDVPPRFGGVNRLSQMTNWGRDIVAATQGVLSSYSGDEAKFTMYFPEAHLLPAASALTAGSCIRLGCQGVHRLDTSREGNFGAFTSCRTAGAMRAIGCESTIIGHCEERADKAGILAAAGVKDDNTVTRILNEEILAAQAAGLSVLYCIGEAADEQGHWEEILGNQLSAGLTGADMSRITIAYEPIWSIGPGRIPADAAYIRRTARFIKKQTGGSPVVYGGGLKRENARMLAGIKEVDGGLIALTRFSGEIGFYPGEYLDIVDLYLRGGKE